MTVEDRNSPHGYNAVEDVVDLLSVWVGLRRQMTIFAGVAATTLLAFIGYVLVAEDKYTAETSIVIEPERDQFVYGEEARYGPAVADAGRIDTEVELLRSKAMASRVLKRLATENGEPTDFDHARAGDQDFLSKRYFGRLADIVADDAGTTTAASQVAIGDNDPSVDSLALDGDDIGLSLEDGVGDQPRTPRLSPSRSGSTPNALDSDQVASTVSDESSVATDPNNDSENILIASEETDQDTTPKSDVSALQVSELMQSIEVERIGATLLIELRVIHHDPVEAARIANIYAEEFILEKIEAQFSALRRANQWIDARLATLKNEVRESEQEAARIRALEGVVDDGAQSTSFANQRIESLAAELRKARTEYTALKSQYEAVRRMMRRGGGGSSVSGVLTSPHIEELRGRLATVEQQIAEYSVRYGDQHPLLVAAQEERAQLVRQLSVENKRMVDGIASRLAVTGSRVTALEEDLVQAQNELADQAASSVRLQELTRNLQAPKAVYEALLSRKRELNERDQLLEADARIVAFATTPDEPSRPRKKLILAGGFIFALILASGAAYIAEMVDGRIRNTRDVRAEFGENAPVVMVPRISARGIIKRPDVPMIATRYILKNPDNLFCESMRELRLLLMSLQAEDSDRSIALAFTSVFGGEGNSTAAFSFATLLASSGHRVAYLDCSSETGLAGAKAGRGGAGHRQLEFSPSNNAIHDDADARFAGEGVSGETAGQSTMPVASRAADGPAIRSERLEEIVKRYPDIPITAQREVCDVQVAALRRDGAFGRFDELNISTLKSTIETLRQHFDYVIIDVPGLMNNPETSLITSAADAVALTLEWCKTSRAAARVGVQRLMEANARILGFLVVKADEKQRYYYRPEDRNFFYRSNFRFR